MDRNGVILSRDIDGTTRICGLIGHPVEHTMSPMIHNLLSDQLGINERYAAFNVTSSQIGEALQGAYALNILGLNATVPHKSLVIPFLKDIDPMAEKIGAVNTLVRDEDKGGFKGYNTDIFGLSRELLFENIDLCAKKVIILGAGGAARCAAFLCAQKKAEQIIILNRTLEKAQSLSDEIVRKMDFKNVSAMATADYSKLYTGDNHSFICFQCTQVGLYPNCDEAVIEDEDFYKLIEYGIDIIYRPLETRFMKLVKANGGRAVNGLRMLLYQAVSAYELWNDTQIGTEQAEQIYSILEQTMQKASSIILIGFMGSGKTTVSRVLSKKLGCRLLDTDEEIVKDANMSVSEIFKQKGEEEFRRLETDELSKISAMNGDRLIISSGGGLPLREKNRELMNQIGTVIYLRTKPETVYSRTRYDHSRPLLNSDNPLEKIIHMQKDREAYYLEASAEIVDTDDKNPDEIADEIIKIVKDIVV